MFREMLKSEMETFLSKKEKNNWIQNIVKTNIRRD